MHAKRLHRFPLDSAQDVAPYVAPRIAPDALPETRYIVCVEAMMTLSPSVVEAIATRAAELLEQRLSQGTGQSKYITPQQAADEILGCKRSRVYYLLDIGALTRYRDEGRVLLLRSEVEDYIASTATRAA